MVALQVSQLVNKGKLIHGWVPNGSEHVAGAAPQTTSLSRSEQATKWDRPKYMATLEAEQKEGCAPVAVFSTAPSVTGITLYLTRTQDNHRTLPHNDYQSSISEPLNIIWQLHTRKIWHSIKNYFLERPNCWHAYAVRVGRHELMGWRFNSWCRISKELANRRFLRLQIPSEGRWHVWGACQRYSGE